MDASVKKASPNMSVGTCGGLP